MKRTINKWLIVTAAGALVFGALAFLFRNSEHDSLSSGDKNCGFCEYIKVELLRLDVSIIPYDGDEIRVVYKNDLPLDIEFGDNSMTISESEKFVISLFSRTAEDFGLWLYLPRKSFREISVYTGQGSISVDKTDCGLIRLITENGDITCKELSSQANITTSKGFVSLDIAELNTNISITSRKGNASVMLPKSSSAAIAFETQTGECVCGITQTRLSESGFFGINGGEKTIFANVLEGTLNIKERE
ncbi:MAG: DUF4097 family beta strand repeat protein [Oscillospiraceae bacterium]|nr:DUF4097 family beta strand repeat protein [Oscillospiraceae bacterium]